MHLPQVQCTMPASHFEAQSRNFLSEESTARCTRVTHAGDQLLRLFAERIDFLSLVQILSSRITVRVILELLNQSFYDSLRLQVFLLNCWERYTLNSVINVTATSFLVSRSVIFFEMLAACVLEMWATSFLVLHASFAWMVGGCSRFCFRRILTSMLQIWCENDSR